MKVPWIGSRAGRKRQAVDLQPGLFDGVPVTNGEPLLVPLELIDEDPGNPRTEHVEAELDELAADIALRGILQPIVVGPASAEGRFRLWFGGKRLRAAVKAGLTVVPVMITAAAHDGYAQVAENMKRHGLTPMDLARFIRGRVDAGESNAAIASKLGIDQTTIAHHLTLLELAPVLADAWRSGRCTSPRTLHELNQLHETDPQAVVAVLEGGQPLTRAAVAALKAAPSDSRSSRSAVGRLHDVASLIDQANRCCDRLAAIFSQMARAPAAPDEEAVVALRKRLARMAKG